MYCYTGISDQGWAAWSQGNWVKFSTQDGQKEVPLPGTNGLFTKVIGYEGRVIAVVKRGEGSGAIVVNDKGVVRELPEESYGNQCVGWYPPGVTGPLRVAYQTPTGMVVRELNAQTLEDTVPAVLTPYSAYPELQGGPAEGFLDITSEGKFLWTHLNRRMIVPGEELYYPYTRGRFTVGLAVTFYGVAVYDSQTKELRKAWEGDTKIQAQVSLGGIVVVSSNLDAPLNQIPFSTWSDRPVYVPPVIGPPPPPPPPDPEKPVDIPNQLELVKSIHSVIQPKNVIEGFEVTKRVAWALRSLGCGLLRKPSGENIVQWDGVFYAAGRVVFKDGHLFKVLSNVGNPPNLEPNNPQNGPTWNDEGIDPNLISKWAEPKDPGDVSIPPGPGPLPPDLPPNPPPLDPTPVLQKLDGIANALESVYGQNQELMGLLKSQQSALGNVVSRLEVLINRPIEFPAYNTTLGYRMRLTPEEKK